jgi:hypothetical protein
VCDAPGVLDAPHRQEHREFIATQPRAVSEARSMFCRRCPSSCRSRSP